MNDKTVINTISAIYFTIVSFLSFILLLLATLFILLQNGLYIDNISVPNIQVKQLYIKWNEKIDISIKEVAIVKKESEKESALDYKEVDRYLKSLALASSWFESIVIEQISFNDIVASFKYKDGERGFIVAASEDFYLNSSLYFESNFLNMEIIELNDFKRKIEVNGNLYFNALAVEFTSSLNIDINKDIDATLLIDADINQLRYRLKSNKDIKSIAHVVNMANLPKEARYWALDAIDMSYLTIQSARGFIDYDNLSEAYKNLHVKATAHKMNYAYDRELDSIHTKSTLLEFREGTLFIYPQEAYSYGMFLDKSWLKIDFSKKEEVLTLHLLFDGFVNKDLLKILNRYKIKLPFLQKKGKVATDLTLVVNLRTIEIDAQGDFFTKKANFNYIGLNIDIYDTYIKLDNHDVQIDNMQASYKDIAKAEVDVKFNAKSSEGLISFQAKYIGFNEGSLLLDKKPLSINYHISPAGDRVSVEKSQWKYDDFILNLNELTVPFDLETLLVKVPATYFELKGISSGFIAGSVNVKTLESKLRTDILKFKHSGVEFSQSNTPINIFYDDKLRISSVSNILFNVNGSEFDLNNAVLDIETHTVTLHHAKLLSTDGLFIGEIDALYNTKSNTGTIDIKGLNIEDSANNTLYYSKEKLSLTFETPHESVRIHSKELDSEFILDDSGWSVKFNSLSKLSKDSDLLKGLKLTEGKVSLFENDKDESVKVNAEIIYPYKILVQENKPTDRYTIKGKLKAKKSFFNINKNVKVTIDEKVKISMNHSGVNMPDLLKLLDEIKIPKSKEKGKDISLNALNSYLYVGNNRRVISDRMALQHINSITTAQLEHANGHAGFKLNDKKMHLYGEDFNDKFMENLLSLSKFRGGKLNFSMNGKISDYDGVFYITDTTILDYKMINNILAFVNTVPSLATFSLPGYSKSGLDVKRAYLNFNAKSSVFNISDFLLDSKEIDILGEGVADLNRDTIDVTLNLKTDLGSSLSKIPLVGYILLGEDTISTTMKISGKLSDPDVKSLLAKDIVVAPVNIVKRTLLLPYDLVKSIKDINPSK